MLSSNKMETVWYPLIQIVLLLNEHSQASFGFEIQFSSLDLVNGFGPVCVISMLVSFMSIFSLVIDFDRILNLNIKVSVFAL